MTLAELIAEELDRQAEAHAKRMQRYLLGPVAALTPAYHPWYAPGYVYPAPPPASAPDPVPPTERLPEPRSEWCCGGTCLRVNCEYHGAAR